MGRIPDSPEAIHPAWLTRALSERHPGVRVVNVEVVERDEVTNAHARLRVAYDPAAGAPEWLFCKMLPTVESRRRAIAQTGMGVREAQFYQRLAPKLALRVPKAHVALHDERDDSYVLLLEELLHSGCHIPDGTVGIGVGAAAGALEDLAELHLRYADPERRSAEAGWVPPPIFDPSYGAALLDHALRNHRHQLSDPFARIAELYVTRAEALHALWEQGPITVIHGDPHLGNLFYDGARVGFLDWGIISTGNPLRDVSYFLVLALSVEDRRAHERDLLRHYLEFCSAHGRSWAGFDEAWRTHRLLGSYCVVASCQAAAFRESISEHRSAYSEAFLARVEAAVEDLDSVGALRECGIR